MKNIALVFLILLLVAISFAHKDNVPHYVKMENPAELVNSDGYFEYIIVKGDCLWFIADKFYNDPFKWTKIHKSNQYIIDPDWIYPNNWLVIPNVFSDANGHPVYSVEGIKPDTSKNMVEGIAIDSDGDGIIDGVDIDGDGMIDAEAGIDIDADGVIEGYDLDGDGEIDIKSDTILEVTHSIDNNGDSIVDGINIDGDPDGKIDIEVGIAATAATIVDKDSELQDKVKKECSKSSLESYCGKPGWKLGLHVGYPLGSAPEDETLNVGLLLGTPLGVKVGPISVGLGAGAFSYDFDKFYFGSGLLASLCINDLLNVNMPVILQLHGAGFYIFGEGPSYGAIVSGSIPFGTSPLSLGLYGGLGKYYPDDNDYDWANLGAILFYSL